MGRVKRIRYVGDNEIWLEVLRYILKRSCDVYVRGKSSALDIEGHES